jgi:dTDP-4-amino-4,6-dideoxygalactose transaminase
LPYSNASDLGISRPPTSARTCITLRSTHHSFYRERFGYQPGLCPHAETVYRKILTLPMFPTLSEADREYIFRTVAH